MPKPRTRKTPATTAPAPTTSKGVKVSDTAIRKLSEMFKILADRSRLKIILALSQEGRMHVGALCKLVDQSQPAVSHHLTLMRMGGLVSFERVGKNNYYHLASDHVRDLLEKFFADAGNGDHTIPLGGFVLSFERT